jgi:hypothetical protein
MDWDKWLWLAMIIFALFFLLIVSICFTEDEKISIREQEIMFIPKQAFQPRPRLPPRTKESVCTKVANSIFGRPFKKIRPDWLRNPRTGRNLECDMYNDDLKLCIEYSGEQHYNYVPRFHKSPADLVAQKDRDAIKRELCAKNGVKIITIPYQVHAESMPFWMCKRVAGDDALRPHMTGWCQDILDKGDITMNA